MSFKPRPPATHRGRDWDEIFGRRVDDPYRWLEDAADSRVQAWMKRQDRFARHRLAAVPQRTAVADRLRELLYYDAISPPIRRGEREFYVRRHKGREKSIVYWRMVGEPGGEGREPAERTLLDPETMSEDDSVSLGVWAPSPDGRLVAYARRQNAADEATLYVREVESGRDLSDRIEGAKYASPSWTPDSAGFYYTFLPTDPNVEVAERPGLADIRFHRIGASAEADPVIRAATGNPRTFQGPTLSRDGRWLIVTVSHGWRSTDVYVRDLSRADSPFVTVVAGRDAIYWINAWRDRLYILTNEDAPRYRVMCVEATRCAREHWRELVAEGESTIESMAIAGGCLVLGYLHNASSRLAVHQLDGALLREVELPGVGTVGGFSCAEDRDEAHYAYSSFTEPPRIFELSIASGDTREWARVEVPLDDSAIETRQVWYPSRDGTPISMFLIQRSDLPARRRGPTILYGYGGFNVSLTPSFAPAVAVWLELGGTYAIANLRGGGEYGEAWHRAGMLLDKQTVFDDFIAAAEYLIAQGITSPEQLAIRGASNGGLLVGAAMTQRPDLFRAVICGVPLLDMVRYHRFGSGATWIPEYGSADDPQQFEALLAYSPYHRVTPGTRYPALLMLSADGDDRVDPMHARKFIAAVQNAHSGAPALLRVERQAGHGGADRVAQEIEQAADIYAFLCRELGVDVTPAGT